MSDRSERVTEQERMTMEVCACGKALYECNDRRHKRRNRIEVVPASSLTEALKERDEQEAEADKYQKLAASRLARIAELEGALGEARRIAQDYRNMPAKGLRLSDDNARTALTPEDRA